MVPPGNSLASTMKAMSSGCEKSLTMRNPSTTMIWLCETVCGDCCVLTPGAKTDTWFVVTRPDELTTQWPAVTTMRLVHNAPLHELLPLMMRTTAVLPSAEVPPTTAAAGVGVAMVALAVTTATIAPRTARPNFRCMPTKLLRTSPRL